MQTPRSAAGAALLLAAAVIACANNPEPAGSDALMSPELVPVDGGGLLDWGPEGSVLDLLRDHLTAATLQRVAPEPLVMIDGMRIGDGLDFLSRLPAGLTHSVRYMRPLEAVRLYGQQAANGAILVRLKSS